MAAAEPISTPLKVPKPFLKWAGGKAKLAPLIIDRAPAMFGRYHEPFVGAGAVFFALARSQPMEATLTDANAALIETFAAVRHDVDRLIGALCRLAEPYLAGDQEGRRRRYYEVRARVPDGAVERAARLIFLNRTCFNGLYRENAAGGFNVPHGRYANPRIVDEPLLRACSMALRGVELKAGDFEASCDAAEAGDFVYLDPPYHPLSATSKFTSYTRDEFRFEDQVRLRNAFDRLTARGVAAILSNSDHEATRGLYEGRGYRLETVSMLRAINSIGAGRTAIPELLVSNFG